MTRTGWNPSRVAENPRTPLEESAVRVERSAGLRAFPVALSISSVRRERSIDTKLVEQTSWISVGRPSVSRTAVCARPELHDVMKHVGRTDLHRSTCSPSEIVCAAASLPDTRAYPRSRREDHPLRCGLFPQGSPQNLCTQLSTSGEGFLTP